MRPIKIRTISSDIKKIKTYIPSDSQALVGVNTERYIDYTDFQDGYVMVYDEEKNRYHFVNPDEILNNTYKQENPPQTFSDEIFNEIFDDLEDNFDIDMGEY
jgi:uncharacterized protein (UPF0218 family)